MTTVREYAWELASNAASSSMAVMKQQVWSHMEQSLAESLDDTNTLMARSLVRDDFREGVASFVEKRPPAFARVTRDDVAEL